MRLDGFLTLKEVTLVGGHLLTGIEASKAGIVRARFCSLRGWPTVGPGELPIGTNIHTDSGRQYMIYCWGGRSPMSDFCCSNFGIGTGIAPEQTTDVALEAPLTFYDSNGDGTADSMYKPVNGIDYPEPFIARVSLTISSTEAQGAGILISEMGLFAADNTLLNRSVLDVPFSMGNVVKTYLWRLRF
jgi:hypothetical protein